MAECLGAIDIGTAHTDGDDQFDLGVKAFGPGWIAELTAAGQHRIGRLERYTGHRTAIRTKVGLGRVVGVVPTDGVNPPHRKNIVRPDDAQLRCQAPFHHVSQLRPLWPSKHEFGAL